LSVSIRDYTISLLAILPGTVLYVFLGASAGTLAESASSGSNATITIVVVVIGVVLGVLAVWLTTRYARTELNRIVEERRALESDTTTTPLEVTDINNVDSNGDDGNDVEAPLDRYIVFIVGGS
jgi:heme/copper-type cytochrome/quinol oxidase subunit 2